MLWMGRVCRGIDRNKNHKTLYLLTSRIFLGLWCLSGLLPRKRYLSWRHTLRFRLHRRPLDFPGLAYLAPSQYNNSFVGNTNHSSYRCFLPKPRPPRRLLRHYILPATPRPGHRIRLWHGLPLRGFPKRHSAMVWPFPQPCNGHCRLRCRVWRAGI